jgi:hypothetical protein
MIYVVNNPIIGEQTQFDTEISSTAYEDALQFLENLRKDILEKETATQRFQIARVIVNGNDSTWLNANLVSDPESPEDGHYEVFDTTIGQYIRCSTLSEAKSLDEQLKNNYIESIGLDKLIEIPEPVANTTNSTT